MTKSELFERVARRAGELYGLEFTRVVFEDLLKDGVISKGERLGNKGKRPNYQYGCRSYKSAMQLVRMISIGIVTRDAQLIQLFLRRHSFPIAKIQRAAHDEYLKHGKNILGQIRSEYINNKVDIPAKRKMSLAKSLGAPDSRLVKAGFVPNIELAIEALRDAKQEPLDLTLLGLSEKKILRRLVGGQIDLGKLDPSMVKVLRGTLLFDADPNDLSSEIDDVEKLLLQSDENSYRDARSLYWTIVNELPKHDFFKSEASSEMRRYGRMTIANSIKNEPVWVSAALTMALMTIKSNQQ